MDEVVMVIVDCPWCDSPVALARPDVVRCDDCRIEVELDPVPVVAPLQVAETALAA
jgi:hypothetical protein